MSLTGYLPTQPVTRRIALKGLLCSLAGVTVYAGEFERHWIELVRKEIKIAKLPDAFDGMTIAQVSDIHLDEFTEPSLLRDAIDQINRMRPDAVFLTGDYVSSEVLPRKLTSEAIWRCAKMLSQLECAQRFSILGNHDLCAGEEQVIEALQSNNIRVLRNEFLPLERSGSRIWLAGLHDPVCGRPDPDSAIPVAIRNIPREPVILMCHGPDYVDQLREHAASESVALVVSGHTHGGQIRLPIIGPLRLPPGGRKYVEGLFQFGSMQLYVNRGIGSIGVPFRFDCRPEITLFTLRAG